MVLGLIGTGQEINKGEEGGVGQWRKAVENAQKSKEWTVHVSDQLAGIFEGGSFAKTPHAELNLTEEVRFHLVTKIHEFVDGVIKDTTPEGLEQIAAGLSKNTYPVYITRDLEKAKDYVRERYYEDKNARYGMLASARDKFLPGFGVLNQFQDSKNMRIGPWFSEGEENEYSCRHLMKPATEFQAQGLELDFSIVCWGGDFIRKEGKWSDHLARKFQAGSHVVNPLQLRVNSYRVLLTRGRDGMIIFVPKLAILDETYEHLKQIGIRDLSNMQD